MLKTKKPDAALHGWSNMVELKVRGQVRDLIRMSDYIPRQLVNHVVYSRKDFKQEKRDLVRRVVKSILMAVQRAVKDRQWAINKMKQRNGYSDQAANIMFETLSFTPDGKLNKKAIENVLNFLIENGLLSKKKAPPVEQLFTPEFIG